MDQPLMSEAAAMNDNSTNFEVNPAIEDDHIADHDRPQNGPVAADTAASRNEIELCHQIPGHNTENGSLLPVNTRNGGEYTALDTPQKNIIKQNVKELHRQISEPESPVFPNSMSKCFSNFDALLTGSALIAGSTYTSIFNSNHSSAKIESFSVREIILCSDRVPNAFYSAVFMTVSFMASMVGILVPLWSMIKKWSFGSRAILLLALAAFFGSYAFAMKEYVPKFWVTIEFFKLSSFCLVWLYGLSLILIPLTILFVAKLVLSIFRKPNGS